MSVNIDELIRKTEIAFEGGAGDIAAEFKPFKHAAPEGALYSLSFVRIHFRRVSGTGDATAALQLTVVDESANGAGDFEFELYEVAQVGIGTDMNLRIPMDELQHWLLEDYYRLKINWTSPDSTNIRWGIQIGMIVW